MGQPAQPMPSPTRAATPFDDQKALDADRTEILVLATGILFLVSQLVLVIWLFAPRAFARTPYEQRVITWRPMSPNPAAQESILSNEDNGRPTRRRTCRRSSTWNGRSEATSHGGHPVRRRKSSDLKPADLDTFSSFNLDPDSSGHDSSVLKGFRDTELAAASLAIPIIPLSPRRLRSPLRRLDPESDDLDEHVRERGLLPATSSPRSPRMGPLNVATMSTILKTNRCEPGSPPVGPPVVDETDLTSVFDDPLGVNRRKTLFGNDNSALIDEGPRGRRHSDKSLLDNERGGSTRGRRRDSR